MSDMPPLGTELEAELAQLQPRSPRRPWLQWAATMVLCIVYAIGMVVVLGLRRDWVELPRTWQLGSAALWLISAAIPLWLIIVPGPGRVLGRWQLGIAMAAAATLTLFVLNVAWQPSGPSSFSLQGNQWRGHGCLEVSVGIAVLPTLLLSYLLRGVYPVGGRAVAAVLGAATASVGGLCLHLHCRIADRAHVALFHCGAVIAMSVVAWYVAPILLDLPWNLRRRRKPQS
jgi:hypothetical protein